VHARKQIVRKFIYECEINSRDDCGDDR